MQDLFYQFRLNVPSDDKEVPKATTPPRAQLDEFLAEIRLKVPDTVAEPRQVWVIIDGVDVDETDRTTASGSDTQALVGLLLEALPQVPTLRVVLLLASDAWIPRVVGYLEEIVSRPTMSQIVDHLRFAARRAGRSIPESELAAYATDLLAPVGNRLRTFREIALGVERLVSTVESFNAASVGAPNGPA
jgi:hypothetical protein